MIEALYRLLNGHASFSSLAPSRPVRTSKRPPARFSGPRFYELFLPVFRFILYPGGRTLITPSLLDQASKEIDAQGLGAAWRAHLRSKSGVIYEVKRTGYLERRVSKDVVLAATILHRTIGVTRNAPLPTTLCQPAKGTWRVYSAELSETHANALDRAAQTNQPIKFRGQLHQVVRSSMEGTTAASFGDVFDLRKLALKR